MIIGLTKILSCRNTFLQISKRAMAITPFTITLDSSLTKNPDKTENLFSFILDSYTLLMNCTLSSQMPEKLERVYNICSIISSWLSHILQISTENVFCLSLLSVSIKSMKQILVEISTFPRYTYKVQIKLYFPVNNGSEVTVGPILLRSDTHAVTR